MNQHTTYPKTSYHKKMFGNFLLANYKRYANSDPDSKPNKACTTEALHFPEMKRSSKQTFSLISSFF